MLDTSADFTTPWHAPAEDPLQISNHV
jgi:hypothetical protein